ncbi:HAD-IIIA family hydrolase [Dysgonomonas sp. ZJ709]|uniref:D-glycero-alpha-D-manno-heptose-1,7-bisphosphate 7-phosphatase n=1 Tax=Dysgonomonas sp. ZJ709 TaxID=2709797 RepID=UPI0013EBDE5E|nr:HAD-IIIA family hydrolase [Dysgonomonas sp. ZJ709]
MSTQNKQFKYVFLDRDGVINEERPDDYVKNISEFIFIEGAIEAIALLTKIFEDIFIITNQRGVGRGIMTTEELDSIHFYMLSQIEKAGGRISKIYFCSDIDSTSINRKPNIGMAFQTKRDFPQVDFKRSIMIGNSRSDIEFGNKAGMYTVLVGDKYPKNDKIFKNINAYYENLSKFVISLQND